MTTIRKQSMNMSNFQNLGEAKVIKEYDDTPKENVAEAMGTTVENLKPQAAISFEKNPQNLPGEMNLSIPEAELESQEPVPQNLTPEQQRNERRAAFKRAADIEQRAVQMQKQAKEQMEQTKNVQKFLSLIESDPVQAIQALGKDPTNFLQRYQNAMFNIPNEPPKPPPEEDIKTRLDRYEQERKREKEEQLQIRIQQQVQAFVDTTILPVIVSNPERFELLNMSTNGLDQTAHFIYDIMDAHYRQTGEQLDPAVVAEEMENQLTKEFEDKIASTKKVKKFAKHFSTDTDAPGQDIVSDLALSRPEVRTNVQLNQSLANAAAPVPGDTSLSGTIVQGLPQQRKVQAPTPAQLVPEINMNTQQRQMSLYSKREQKLKKMEQSLAAGVLPMPRGR